MQIFQTCCIYTIRQMEIHKVVKENQTCYTEIPWLRRMKSKMEVTQIIKQRRGCCVALCKPAMAQLKHRWNDKGHKLGSTFLLFKPNCLRSAASPYIPDVSGKLCVESNGFKREVNCVNVWKAFPGPYTMMSIRCVYTTEISEPCTAWGSAECKASHCWK